MKGSRHRHYKFVKTPGGKVVIHRIKRKKTEYKAKCYICGEELKGVDFKGKLVDKRNERDFGGILCGKCSEELSKWYSLYINNQIGFKEIPYKFRKLLTNYKGLDK